MGMSEDGRRASLAVRARCALGEGATWCARTGRFYWTDIEGSRLYRYDPCTGERTSWAMPERLATFALCADPHYLLLGLATHLAFFDLTTREMRRIVEVEPGLDTRLNDGRCDRQGRFVFGTKHEGATLSAVQTGFKAEHGLQCGFCTPGMMMTATSLLEHNDSPTEGDIRAAISGNLCRCTGYVNIIKAIQHAAAEIRGESPTSSHDAPLTAVTT